MNSSSVMRLLLATLVAGTLVACGSAPARSALPGRQPQETIPGLKEAGPLPRYEVAMSLGTDAGRLKGRQQVWIPNRSSVDWGEVVFRLYPNLPQYGGEMGVGPVWVDGRRSPSELRPGGTVLVVRLPRRLRPEASVTISMTYYVDLPQPAGGYVLLGHSQGVWSVPDAYPLLAVHDASIQAGTGGSGLNWHEEEAPAHGDAVFAEAALYTVSLTLPPTLTLVTMGSAPTRSRGSFA
jgi:hypothetical protein